MALASAVMPPVAFSTAFERLKEVVSKDDLRSFNSTTMQDVWTTARDIERHLESRRSLRGFRRIQPFLAGIEQYSKVVEVLCNGTPYLPYIWAPIKLLLQIAQGHILALEKLIDAYAMIGEAMPRFDRLSAAFKDDPEFQQVMGYFYEDILEFHRRAYMFFRRRSWKLVFDSLWKSFNLRFSGILESLRKHRDLIDQEANARNIAEAKTWRTMQLEQFRQWRADRAHDIDRLERERLASQIREAVAWFGASEDHEDYYTRYSRSCDGTNGHWALEQPIIVSWLDQNRDNPVLWLNGKPGAGKSVICSKLIEHIQEKTNTVTIFYFFNHNQTFPKHATEVLRSFATQLLAASTGLAPYILETFANNGQRATKRNLAIIIEKMIASLQDIRIVADGLDECPQDEQDEVIEDLLRIRGPVPGACKVLLSSRKHRNISKLLQSKPTFRLDDNAENINATIASFIQPRLQSLQQAFSSEIIDELGYQILVKANGMFLWVKLIMFTLEDLHFESDVRETIKKLPEDLETVYERIFLRICGSGKTPNQRTAIRILQWMLVAHRPLKRCELESGIVLDERVSQISTATRPRGDVLSLCHPIIDVEDGLGGSVSFIHFTAQEYLRKLEISPFFQFRKAQLAVSLSCVLYLSCSLELVDPRVTGDEIRSNVAEGFHDLHLYANDHWLDHLRGLVDSLADSHLNGAGLRTLNQALERLTLMHNELAALRSWNNRGDNDLSLSPRGNIWHPLQISQTVQKLLDGLLAYRNDASVNNGMTAASHSELDTHPDPTMFSMLRTRYQDIMEGILESEQVTNTALHDFRARHNSGGFLCRYRNCPRAAQGFNTQEDRQKHEESHALTFRCTNAACGFFGLKFNTRGAMKHHAAQYHDEEDITSVPSSLTSRPRGSREDRPLFSLTEVKTKKIIEGISLRREFEIGDSIYGTSSDIRQHIMRELNSHPTLQIGWQKNVFLPHRVEFILELVTKLSSPIPKSNPIKFFNNIAPFEKEQFEKAPDWSSYKSYCWTLFLQQLVQQQKQLQLQRANGMIPNNGNQAMNQQQFIQNNTAMRAVSLTPHLQAQRQQIALQQANQVATTQGQAATQPQMAAQTQVPTGPDPVAAAAAAAQQQQQQIMMRQAQQEAQQEAKQEAQQQQQQQQDAAMFSEDFDFEEFLQTSDGDFNFDPATFETTIPDVSSHLKRMSAARAMSPTTAEHGSIGQRSPFRESSKWSGRLGPAPPASAAELREQQKNEAAAQELQKGPYGYGEIPDSPETIAPGESLLDYIDYVPRE